MCLVSRCGTLSAASPSNSPGVFSFVSWPFSLKILWAPLVDSLYFPALGQRRTWLIPVQVCWAARPPATRCGPVVSSPDARHALQSVVGALLLLMGPTVEGLLASGDTPDGGAGAGAGGVLGAPPYVQRLTALFFCLYLLMATQDVAVDGWALTLLSRRNVGLASTVNVVAQTLGFFLAYTGFLTLSDQGWVTLAGFMRFWGCLFVASAAVVAASREGGYSGGAGDAKHASASSAAPGDGGVAAVYAHAWRLVRLRSVQRLLLVLLTCRVAFGAAEALTTFKLLDAGFTKAQVAYMATLVAPLNIALPLLVARWTNGDAPWSAFLGAYPVRLAVNLATALVLARPPAAGSRRTAFTLLVVLALSAQAVVSQVQFVAQMAFFARVSDPSIGGTAMTLFNTVANLGSKWPSSLALFMAEPLTRRVCHAVGGESGGPCSTAAAKEACLTAGGACVVESDAFMPLTLVCTLLGIAWLELGRRHVVAMQQLPLDAWLPSAQQQGRRR